MYLAPIREIDSHPPMSAIHLFEVNTRGEATKYFIEGLLPTKNILADLVAAAVQPAVQILEPPLAVGVLDRLPNEASKTLKLTIAGAEMGGLDVTLCHHPLRLFMGWLRLLFSQESLLKRGERSPAFPLYQQAPR